MGGFDIVGCIADDDNPERLVLGVPIIDGEDRIETLASEGHCAAIGVGGWVDNANRIRLFNRAIENDLEIVTAIHPSAILSSSSEIGRGSVIGPRATIGACTKVGQNVIVHTGAIIGHQTLIADHVLISGGAVVGAGTIIEEKALISIGATVASKVIVGSESLISAGTVVTNNVPNGARMRGAVAQVRGRNRTSLP